MSVREPLNSRRLHVINHQTSEMHDNVASINEALVDKDRDEALTLIDSIRAKLNILKDQIVHGDIV